MIDREKIPVNVTDPGSKHFSNKNVNMSEQPVGISRLAMAPALNTAGVD